MNQFAGVGIMVVIAVLFLASSEAPRCIEDGTEKVREIIVERIEDQSPRVKRQWTPKKISQLTRAIVWASLKTGESPVDLIALIETESGFNKSAVNRNQSSTDRGLWQLNSKYTPGRAREVLKRDITISDYYDITNSTKLMTQVEEECSNYSGLWFAVCYNNPVAARKGILTKHGERFLENRDKIPVYIYLEI